MPILKTRTTAKTVKKPVRKGKVRGTDTEVLVVADVPVPTESPTPTPEPSLFSEIDGISPSELRLLLDYKPQSPAERRIYKDMLEYAEEIMARRCLDDVFTWLTYGTKSKDEQAKAGEEAFRPFPRAQFIRDMLTFLEREKGAAIWKSRTVMGTWTVAGHCTHMAFTRESTKVLYQSNDETRALNMVEYSKVLWENSLERLKLRWKLTKPIEHQSKSEFEAANGSSMIGIPGYSTKIKSHHPTIYVHDEAAISENLDECIAEAASTLAHQVILVSSSWLGHMNDLWEACREVDWYEDDTHAGEGARVEYEDHIVGLKTGVNSMEFKRRRELAGKRDGAGGVAGNVIEIKTPTCRLAPGGARLFRSPNHDFAFLDVAYNYNPLATPEKLSYVRRQMRSQAQWEREMERNPRAAQGALVYPEFNRELHVVSPEDIPDEMTLYCSIDPHPRTPHSVLWLGVDKYNDWYVYRELWPSIAYGTIRRLEDDEAENQFAIWEYASTMAQLEGNHIEFTRTGEEGRNKERGKYVLNEYGGEKVFRRYMDQAGKGFLASAEQEQKESFADRYRRFGIYCMDPKKSVDAGQDAVRDALKLRYHSLLGQRPRLLVSSDCTEIITEFENYRYAKTSSRDDAEDQNQKTSEFRRHGMDNLRYIIATYEPRYMEAYASVVNRVGMKKARLVNLGSAVAA